MATNPETDLSFVPDHVPPELVWPHDLNAFARTLEDPFQIGIHLRKGPPIVYSRGATRGQPGWVPTRHELLREIFMDTERFSSAHNVGIDQILGVEWRLNPIDYDPPEHTAYRQVLQPLFMPKAINKYETMVRTIANELIASFEHQKSCDFMTDFAIPFPSYVFLDLAGLPREMLPTFFQWEHAVIRGKSIEERRAGLEGIRDYFQDYVKEHRNDNRDNLVSTIINGKVNGRPLNEGEILGMCMVIYLGGLDTVLSSLGWHMRYLARNKPLQDRLRKNPGDIVAAVDDFYRAYGVTTTRRYVSDDIEFHGVRMKKGDRILMPMYLASRDPDQFENPDLIDPDRKPRSLTFATGPHNCIGAHLARRETKVVLEAFLSRFDNIRMDDSKKESWQTDGVWAMTQLPIEWD